MQNTISFIIFFSGFIFITFLYFAIANQIRKREINKIMAHIDLSDYRKIDITYNQSLIQTSSYNFNAHLFINESSIIITSTKKAQFSHMFNFLLPLTIPKKQSTGDWINSQSHVQSIKIKTWKKNRITIQVVWKRLLQTSRFTVTLNIKNDNDMQMLKDYNIDHWC